MLRHDLEAVSLVEGNRRIFCVDNQTDATHLLRNPCDTINGVEQQKFADLLPLVLRSHGQSSEAEGRDPLGKPLLKLYRQLFIQQLQQTDGIEANHLRRELGFGRNKGFRDVLTLVLAGNLNEPPIQIVVSAIESVSVMMLT